MHAAELITIGDDVRSLAAALARARRAAQIARGLQGAALQALEDRRRSPRKKRRAARLDEACPPDAEGFATVHGGDPAEAADARAAARLSVRSPALAAVVRSGALPPAVARELERGAEPAGLEAWAAFAGTVPPDRLLELATAAARGQAPGPALEADARVADGRTSDRGWRLDRTLSLRHPEAWAWWKAWKLAAAGPGRKVRASQSELLADMVFTLKQHVESNGWPIARAALRPFGEYLIDPIRQVAWLQCGRGRLAIGLDEVPPPGNDVRTAVIAETGRVVGPTDNSLLHEFPELADPPAVPAPGEVRWPAPAAVARQVVTDAPASGPLPPLPAAPATLSDLDARSDDELKHLAAGAATAANALRCAEVRLAARLAAAGGGPPAPALGYSARTWADTVRMGQALARLPAVAAAFAAGRLCYAKVRVLIRRATPATATAWTELAQAVTVTELESFVAAAPRGAPPPVAPSGQVPIRPRGGRVVERVRARLARVAGRWLVKLRRHLRRLGVPRGLEHELPALLGWYVRARQSPGAGLRATTQHHWVVYLRSPETRAAADHPRALVAPALRHTPDRTARLRHAFHWVFEDPAHASPGVRGDDVLAPRSRGLRPPRKPLAERVPVAVALARRWLDGEVCAVPGCTRDRVTQHDHWNPRRFRGRADVEKDRRLCGPCNRARARGLLDYRHVSVGTVIFTDGRHRALGSVRLGGAWAAPIRAWAERLAEHQGLQHPLGGLPAGAARATGAGAGGAVGAGGPPEPPSRAARAGRPADRGDPPAA